MRNSVAAVGQASAATSLRSCGTVLRVLEAISPVSRSALFTHIVVAPTRDRTTGRMAGGRQDLFSNNAYKIAARCAADFRIALIWKYSSALHVSLH